MAKRLEVTYRVYEDGTALAHAAAKHFAERVAQSVEKRGRARIAISGGSTPKATFALLADPAQPYGKNIPWDKVELFWVDERTVGPDDPDSNYRMTRENLLSKVAPNPDKVHRIEGELDPEEAAAKYETVIRREFRLEGAEVPRFDVVWLGMGDDGHTASLFPHTEGIHELGRIAFANHVPQKDTWRITLSAPVINEALEVVFLIGGDDKAAPLERVLYGEYDPAETPSQLIQPKNGSLLFLLDTKAAAKLPKPGADHAGHVELAR
ncbi:6-phosphogluconolactonase [Acidipila sp. EB88]|uniref:6-phosphogluconolactonase n=1 Tax=Acidipila sp. EB88 TaxID=2305226 RepID=UPI000F5D7411|nr:6-phosphogluconolactonase [Acidipila sp. EB88]RRA47702.1 6-phosphogluconolactonase [Acidipila sp. EB88]